MGESFDAGTLSRYDMSFSTYRQLQRDHIRFVERYTEKFSNGYICRILINSMCYAQDHFLERLENDVVNILNDKRHNEYIKDDRISFTKQLNNKISEFDFSANTAFKKRTTITFLLEQFTQLPLSEREMVFCYHQAALVLFSKVPSWFLHQLRNTLYTYSCPCHAIREI